MVWIHGGGYRLGSGAYSSGIPLASRGVVVVTLNYRMDALGMCDITCPLHNLLHDNLSSLSVLFYTNQTNQKNKINKIQGFIIYPLDNGIYQLRTVALSSFIQWSGKVIQIDSAVVSLKQSDGDAKFIF